VHGRSAWYHEAKGANMLTLMFMALATTTAVFCLVMSCGLALERPTLK
jgi:hypothetical protein